jgi:anionic cell wall polymer biosynthesis LytR-Cps2A-Psr (LCP) family protein
MAEGRVRVRGLGFGSSVAGKVAYAVACFAAVVVVVAAGYAHKVVGLTKDISAGASIGSSPSVGAMNILLMGLESRTNFQGQILSAQQLTETHSGKESVVKAGQEGSQDTDTLILIHIFAGGQKAMGFSIPRDDVVNYPHATFDGLTEGKVDAAYAYAYNQSLGQTAGQSMSSKQRYLLANQAGQQFQVQTVESVTGVHIDHLVVSNIIGFYYLAQQFGGMEVCLKPAAAQGGFKAAANLTDYDPLTLSDNSGFDAYHDGYSRKKGGAQYLHLSAAQSLAFVRSRDTLPGVDIGRTARQQAAIDYVVWKVKHDGLLSDTSTLSGLLSNASQYLIVDQGFNLLDFATDMKAFSGKDLSFTTLVSAPTNDVTVPGYPSPQSVNFIYVPRIQHLVNTAFYGSASTAPSPKSVTVDVYNGSGTPGLAGEASQAFAALGYNTGQSANSSVQSQKLQDDTQIFYGSGAETNADAIADDMGTTAASLSSLPAGHVEVLLGSQVTALPPGLEEFGASTVTAADYRNAAQQDNTPAADMPPASATQSATTQSVSAVRAGTHPAAASAAHASKQSSKRPTGQRGSGGLGGGGVTVPKNAPYGIPCVY